MTLPPSGRIRLSRLRVAFQVCLHAVLIAHVVLYYYGGIRPIGGLDVQDFFHSFLGEGVVTAGALLLAVAFLGAFVFGRVFCSWGCHFGATQDFAAWLLRKCGWKPPLLRTRILHLAPYLLLAGVFLLPQAERWAAEGWEFRGFELGRGGPWDRLPGALLSVVTFLACGCGLLFFLGTRGFCRFLCPYGALLRPGERLAPLRVRKKAACTDACSGGRAPPCTAACPTAIDVHRETAISGAVRSADCVRCNLCVEACPQGALGVFWREPRGRSGTATVGEPPPVEAPLRFPEERREENAREPFALTFAEEALVLGTGVLTFLSVDLVYGGHFLAGAIALGEGFLALQVVRLAASRSLRVGPIALRESGRITVGGVCFAGVFLLSLVPVYEAGAFKFARARAFAFLDRAAALDGERRQHELRRSVEWFEAALSRFPRDQRAREGFAAALFELETPSAVEAYEGLLRSGPASETELERLYWLYVRFGRLEKARLLEERLRKAQAEGSGKDLKRRLK